MAHPTVPSQALDKTILALRGEEVDPLSTQYVETVLVQNEAVVVDPGASYAPNSAGLAMGGYSRLSLSIYLLGGIGAAATNRTVTVTVEASDGLTVAAALMWPAVTESVKSMLTGVDSAPSFTSTGTTAYSDILTLRNEDANVKLVRVKYDWDDDPSVTAGKIVVVARQRAL